MNAINAGTYVRLRRQAAGLTVEQVALQLSDRSQVAQNAARIALDKLEGNHQDRDYLSLVWELVRIFPLDPFVYLALIGFEADPHSELPRPRICNGCGCTWDTPCRQDDGNPCSWTEGSDYCSACPNPNPGPGEERPLADAETRHAA